MLVLNIMQIYFLEVYNNDLWIDGVPALVFGFGVVLIFTWAVLGSNLLHSDNMRPTARTTRTAGWWARSFAIASVILTILAPFAIMQFWYMDTIAMPLYNQTEWVTSVETTESFRAPTVNFSISYLQEENPEINVSVLDYRTLNTFPERVVNAPSPACETYHDINYTKCTRYWATSLRDTAFSFKLGESVVWSAYITGANPQYQEIRPLCITTNVNAVGDPRFVIASHELINLPFTLSDSQADGQACDGTGDFIDYFPWTTTDTATSTFQYRRINDPFSTLNGSCSRSYNSYTTTTQAKNPDFTSNNTFCANGCTIYLWLVPTSKIVTVLTNQRRIDANRIIVDEAGVLGAVAFFAWFLGIYVIGIDDESNERQGPVCEETPPDHASNGDDEVVAP